MTERLQLRPAVVEAGQTVEAVVLIRHPQENGMRRDAHGERIPRNLINVLRLRYGDRTVFQAELGTGIAANPLLIVELRAERTGPVDLTWEDDAGNRGATSAQLTVRGA
jgi:sulfur-oxidizing protein SoxZ